MTDHLPQVLLIPTLLGQFALLTTLIRHHDSDDFVYEHALVRRHPAIQFRGISSIMDLLPALIVVYYGICTHISDLRYVHRQSETIHTMIDTIRM